MQANDNPWVEVRSNNGRLLFKFHPLKNIIEQKSGQQIYTVDLDDQTVSERPAAVPEKLPNFRPGGLLNWGK